MRALWVVGVFLVLILLVPSVVNRYRSPQDGPGPADLHPGPAIFEMGSGELDRFLENLSERGIPLEDRLRILALGRVGTPYARDCLGEGGGTDPDPVFRVDSTDCTVFILTQAAMAHAASLEEARDNMRRANYREVGGDRPVAYAHRLHFTTDRLRASPYFEDITALVAGRVPLEETTLTLNRRADGSRLLPIEWERQVTVSYVPVGQVCESLLDRLPAVAGAALVKKAQFEMGVGVAHEGMVLDRRDFIHASSVSGEIVHVPFLDYLFPTGEEPRFDGVIFYQFH